MTTPIAPKARQSTLRQVAPLALLAGVTDVTSWVLLGGLFTAHVTGNLVVIAANIVTGTPPRLAAVLALPVFILTAIVSTAVARSFGKDRREKSRNVLLGAQTALLLAAAVLSFTTKASTDPDAPLAVIIGMLAVAAMAAQNAYLHLIPAKAPSTAVMTGNLATATIAAFDLLTSRGKSTTARSHWSETWPLLAGFILGCLVGAAAARIFGDHAAVVPAVLAVIIYFTTAFRPVPSDIV